jgi:hypothetical protein
MISRSDATPQPRRNQRPLQMSAWARGCVCWPPSSRAQQAFLGKRAASGVCAWCVCGGLPLLSSADVLLRAGPHTLHAAQPACRVSTPRQQPADRCSHPCSRCLLCRRWSYRTSHPSFRPLSQPPRGPFQFYKGAALDARPHSQRGRPPRRRGLLLSAAPL